MEENQFKKGDYVKVTKISCYGEYISYLSIIDSYDNENNILYEIISCLESKNVNDFEALFYNSMTEDIINISIANELEKERLNNLMKDIDNIYYDNVELKIKNYE